MSGFSEDAFSLDALRETPAPDSLEPGALGDLHYALRVQGWRERGRRLRDLTEQILAEAYPELLSDGPPSPESGQGGDS
jgi:hypothetical protein